MKKGMRMKKRLLSLVLLTVMLVTMPGMVAAARTVPGNPSLSDNTVYWDWIYFGSYPQSEVKSPSAAIVNAEYSATGDAWVDGVKYRRISALDTTNSANFGSNTYRYFKWERIRWQVFRNEGDTLFLGTWFGIDCQQYNKSNTDTSWSKCTLRSWLNTSFYNTAFSARERNSIVASSVDNSMYNEGKTTDYVYILSPDEAEDSNYGFYEGVDEDSPLREYKTTNYAYCMGAKLTDNDDKNVGYCWWWLRAPGDESAALASKCDPHGNGYWQSAVANGTTAVIPVLRINTTSEFWDDTDDGTSGDGGETIIKEQTITCGTDKIDEDGKIVYGTKAFSLKASTDGDGKLTYKSSDKSVVTVSSAGKVTVKGYGAATITITAAATNSCKKAALKIKVTVVPKKATMKKPKPSGSNIVLSWEADKTVTGYQYSYAKNEDFEGETKVNAKTATSVTLKALKKGTTYHVRVRAYKKVGSKTYYGEWSNSYYFTVPK